MTPSEHMLAALRERGLDVPAGSVIRRTYAGRNQRAEGSWTWFVLTPAGAGDIGSQWTLAELLRRGFTVDRDRYGQTHVDPVGVDLPAR